MRTQGMVWIDIETTGLTFGKDKVLEVACVITDIHGTPQQWWSRVCLPAIPSVMEELIETMRSSPPGSGARFVYDMHESSGLWGMVLDEGISLLEMDQELATWLDNASEEYHLIPGKVPMMGSSVHFDKYMMAEPLPQVSNWFSHRIIDISSFKELSKYRDEGTAEAWVEYCAGSIKPHRALDDIKFSIEEYEFYIAQGFIQ